MSTIVPRNEYERRLVENVQTYGCQVTHVFGENGALGFSYSIGFPKTVGQPEVFVSGLSSEVMHHMINETPSQCREGLQLLDWAPIDGLLGGHNCVARRVDPSWIVRDHFNSAMWYLRESTGEEMTEAFQLVWPSAVNGAFPWDVDCPPELHEVQAALYDVRMPA